MSRAADSDYKSSSCSHAAGSHPGSPKESVKYSSEQNSDRKQRGRNIVFNNLLETDKNFSTNDDLNRMTEMEQFQNELPNMQNATLENQDLKVNKKPSHKN